MRDKRKRLHKENETAQKKRSVLIPAIAAAACAVVVFCAVAALKGRDSMELAEPFYTSVNGMRMEWESGRLVRDDGVTYIRQGRQRQSFEEYPLIKADESEIILQRSCSLYRTTDDMFYRVDYFTRAERGENGVILRRRGKELEVAEGFLYDNEDTYLFLENAELSYGEESLAIGPMTVVQVSYMGHIQIFGPGLTPQFSYLTNEEPVTAQFEGGKKVNLTTDRFYMQNGTWRLLFFPLDKLQAAM